LTQFRASSWQGGSMLLVAFEQRLDG
jgi:hypothetical protein